MIMHFSIVLIAGLAMQPGAGAHDDHYRSPNLKPRIALISNEVAAQRLRVAGIDNVRIVGREARHILLEGVVGGRRMTLRMNAVTGEVVDARNPARIVLPVGRSERPRVTGPQLQLERSRIADPDLMREAVRSPD
jgi:hypothetical protein